MVPDDRESINANANEDEEEEEDLYEYQSGPKLCSIISDYLQISIDNVNYHYVTSPSFSKQYAVMCLNKIQTEISGNIVLCMDGLLTCLNHLKNKYVLDFIDIHRFLVTIQNLIMDHKLLFLTLLYNEHTKSEILDSLCPFMSSALLITYLVYDCSKSYSFFDRVVQKIFSMGLTMNQIEHKDFPNICFNDYDLTDFVGYEYDEEYVEYLTDRFKRSNVNHFYIQQNRTLGGSKNSSEEDITIIIKEPKCVSCSHEPLHPLYDKNPKSWSYARLHTQIPPDSSGFTLESGLDVKMSMCILAQRDSGENVVIDVDYDTALDVWLESKNEASLYVIESIMIKALMKTFSQYCLYKFSWYYHLNSDDIKLCKFMDEENVF